MEYINFNLIKNSESLSPTVSYRREWIALAVLSLPVLLVSMDLTVMFLVVPSLSEQLKPSAAELLWVTDIFGFLEASMLITMGTLGDRIGRRKLLIIGGTVFAIASAIAAYSQTIGQLILARAILGIAGASLLPSTLSLIRNLFHDRKQRTLALGIFTTIFSAGTMLGPLVGGVLLDQFGWGSVFLIAVPLMVLFLILAPFLLPEFKDAQPGKFDLISALLSALAILPLMYGIKKFAEEGFAYDHFLIMLLGLIAAAAFVYRQKLIPFPLINLKLFRNSTFSITLITMWVAVFAWAGMFLFVTQQLQLVMGMSAFRSGLWTIFGAIGSIIFCSIAPQVVRYIRREVLLAIGLLLMSTGLAIMFLMSHDMTIWTLVISIFLLSGGCGLTVTIGHDIILSSAVPEQAGAVAAITETFTTLGGSIGIALLGSIGTIIYRSGIVNVLDEFSVPETELGTLGNTINTASQYPSAVQLQIIEKAHVAFGDSFSMAAGISALLLIIMSAILFKSRNPR